MNNFLIISYYTEGFYEKVFDKYLGKSLQNPLFEDIISCDIQKRPNLKNWTENTRQKIDVILKALQENPYHDIVFIDADGTLNEYPKLFQTIPHKYDLGIHTLKWKEQYGKPGDEGKTEILSGTLFLRNNKKIIEMVKDWKIETIKHNWEQRALIDLIPKHNIKVYNLPREYCYITSQPNGNPPAMIVENPVISHWQISRAVKKNKRLLNE